MEYLKVREQTMRNTNESTNARVKYFATVTSISFNVPNCRSSVTGVVCVADYVSSDIFPTEGYVGVMVHYCCDTSNIYGLVDTT
jgi:hypothetical protein